MICDLCNIQRVRRDNAQLLMTLAGGLQRLFARKFEYAGASPKEADQTRNRSAPAREFSDGVAQTIGQRRRGIPIGRQIGGTISGRIDEHMVHAVEPAALDIRPGRGQSLACGAAHIQPTARGRVRNDRGGCRPGTVPKAVSVTVPRRQIASIYAITPGCPRSSSRNRGLPRA